MNPFLSLRIWLFATLFLAFTTRANCQDLPAPPSNIQSMPVGSYIIPMDNFYQFNSAGLFNIKAYGLLVHLLNNNVKLKWIIKSGKQKDSSDINVSTTQILPTIISTPRVRALKSGPFVIFPQDTAGVAALVNSFYILNGLTANDRPKILKNGVSAWVDVRYDMQGFLPKAAILNDGGNEFIHVQYMIAAAVPTVNYAISAGKDLITGCYTFASEPHNDREGPIVDTAIMSIRNFVQYGGNFLAQCDAVINYENSSYGRFQTTTGVAKANVNVGTTVSYLKPDLSYSQFEGAYSASAGGSVRNWRITDAGINNHHNHVTGTGTNSSVVGASVSKLKTGQGGLVFYLGNHEYGTSSQISINGLRMYMNAFLTPSLMPCNFYLLNANITSFSGEVWNNKVSLNWTVSENQSVARFRVERSFDGKSYSTMSIIPASLKAGTEQYIISERSDLKFHAYYRIWLIKSTGKEILSKIISVTNGKKDKMEAITLLSNPINAQLRFNYSSLSNERTTLKIYNSNGINVFSGKVTFTPGVNTLTIPAENLPAEKGIYILEIINSRGRLQTKFIKG